MKIKFVAGLIFCAALVLAAAEPQRPRITGLSHVAFYVHDLDKSRAFYEDLLGYQEPYSLSDTNGHVQIAFIKINDTQSIELYPEKGPATDCARLSHIAILTDDAEALRNYLASRGVKVPGKVNRGRIGNLNFNILDPDGHRVEFVQYLPNSWMTRNFGKSMSGARISTHLRHAGIIVTNLDASLKFYHDILGFQEIWRGAATSNQLSWVNMKVPDGSDYVELMLFNKMPPPDKRSSSQHISLEVADMEKAKAALETKPAIKNYSRPLQIKIGKNRKRQMNLWDPDGTRVEFMESNTVDGKPAPWSTAPFPEIAATNAITR